MRKPSAWLPIVMSLTALGMVIGYVALNGVTELQGPQDEGGPARLFQMLMLSQALVIAYFAVRWLPKAPRQATTIIALQLLVAAVPIATIVILES